LASTAHHFVRPFLLYGGLLFSITRRAVFVGLILLFIHLFVVTVVPVSGGSMVPTLLDGTYVLTDIVTTRFVPLTRGEIVALRYPLDPSEKFIKRVIGIPGDRVVINDGKVSIERPGDTSPFLLDEAYLSPDSFTEGERDVSLGENEYYILGDNREVSLDSRTFGPVTPDIFIGRAWVAVWPVNQARKISAYDPTLHIQVPSR
jgi:signal peptidase I